MTRDQSTGMEGISWMRPVSPRTGWWCSFVLLAGFILALKGSAQPTAFAPWDFERPRIDRDYNLKVGPVLFDLGGQMTVTYDDNINTSELSPVSDLILYPSLNLRMMWEYGFDQAVLLNLGLGYEKFVDHSHLDTRRNVLALSPDSELAVRVQLGGMVLQLFERFSYLSDAVDAVRIDPETGNLVTDIERYQRTLNRMGVRGYYDLNLVQLSFGAERADERPEGQEFRFRRHREYLLHASVHRTLAANLRAGLSSSYSDLDYAEDFQNRGRTFSAGPYTTWAISEFTRIRGGLNRAESRFAGGGANQDPTTRRTSVSGNLEIQNDLNRNYHHLIRLVRSVSYGFVTNLRTTQRIQYRFVATPLRWWELTGSFAHERSRDSGGLFPDRFNRYESLLEVRRELGEDIRLTARVQHAKKNSQVAGRSYEKRQVALTLHYDF